MRLICTIEQNHENPFAFSYYLKAKGIANECEEVESTLKTPQFHIWIYDEDQVEAASNFYKEYQKNPDDPRYRANYEQAFRQDDSQEKPTDSQDEPNEPKQPSRRPRFLSPSPYGTITVLILLAVISLFLWAQFQRKAIIPAKIKGVIQAPVLAPFERNMLYDYPEYFDLRDRFLTLYTPKDAEEKIPPSPEALSVLNKLRNTPVWMGVYDIIVQRFSKSPKPFPEPGPLFTKIRQGEVWRVFTPALLHLDLLHIFFNVLWFILLANQVEFRLGKWRFLLLILVSGIISNTAQYLMSGPFFLGLSGIVCALAGFIWARQQVAPWEGYLLHRFTLIFLALFVMGMFLIQLVFFFMQILGSFELAVGIANAAHIAGGLTGYLLGRMRLFSIRHKKNL